MEDPTQIRVLLWIGVCQGPRAMCEQSFISCVSPQLQDTQKNFYGYIVLRKKNFMDTLCYTKLFADTLCYAKGQPLLSQNGYSSSVQAIQAKRLDGQKPQKKKPPALRAGRVPLGGSPLRGSVACGDRQSRPWVPLARAKRRPA